MLRIGTYGRVANNILSFSIAKYYFITRQSCIPCKTCVALWLWQHREERVASSGKVVVVLVVVVDSIT
jgi:hypothetical protein